MLSIANERVSIVQNWSAPLSHSFFIPFSSAFFVSIVSTHHSVHTFILCDRMDPFHHDWDTRSFAEEHHIQYMYCLFAPFTHLSTLCPPAYAHTIRLPFEACTKSCLCAFEVLCRFPYTACVGFIGRTAPLEPSGWAGGSPRSTTRSSTTRCWSASRRSTIQTSPRSCWHGEFLSCGVGSCRVRWWYGHR